MLQKISEQNERNDREKSEMYWCHPECKYAHVLFQAKSGKQQNNSKLSNIIINY